MTLIESPFTQIIADLAKNNKNLTPRLQDAIAQYLEYQVAPVYSIDKTAKRHPITLPGVTEV
jgi:hypothetical protein